MEATAEQCVALAVSEFGKLDILINNAGAGNYKNLVDTSAEEYDALMDSNIKSSFLFTRHAAPVMIAQKGGEMLFISSVAGLTVGPGGAVYSATKFAVRAISEGLRQECVGKVRVTSICPGLVTSELTGSITVPAFRERGEKLYEGAMPADSIADAIVYAITQPEQVAVNEIVVRPLTQGF